MQVMGSRLWELLGLRLASNLLGLALPFPVSFLSDVWGLRDVVPMVTSLGSHPAMLRKRRGCP